MKSLLLQARQLYRRNLRQQKKRMHQFPKNPPPLRREECLRAAVVDLWEEGAHRRHIF